MLVGSGEPVYLCVLVAEIKLESDVCERVKVHLYAASVEADRTVDPLDKGVVVLERTPSIVCCLSLNERPHTSVENVVLDDV